MKTNPPFSKLARGITFAMFLFAAFTTAFAQNCIADFKFTVKGTKASFTNTSKGSKGIYYLWNFGDGNYDSAKNPVYTFKNKGTYIVCLSIRDSSSSCQDTICKSVVIAAGCNPISIIGSAKNPSNTSSCNGTISLTSIKGGVAPYVYTWSPNVSHSSSASKLCGGSYNITVTDAKGCTGTTSFYIQGSSTKDCKAGFNFTVKGTKASFTNTSKGSKGLNYFWNFGDGNYDNTKNPVHIFKNKGTYTVYLSIRDSLSSCFDTISKSVVISSGCNLLTVVGNAKDPSIFSCDGAISITSIKGGVAPYAYAWSPNVSHTSSASNLCRGLYDITVTDAKGCTGLTSFYLIQDTSNTGECNAGFTYVVNGNSATFTNTSTGGTLPLYRWNFGDNSGDWTKNPVHLFNRKGFYTVCLTMYDSLGTCNSTICDTVEITVGCDLVSVTGNGTNPSSLTSCDGSISAYASGGVLPYAYTWLPNVSNSSSASNLCGGRYDITVTDANGCTGMTIVFIQDSSNTGSCSANFDLFPDTTSSDSLSWYLYPHVTGVAPFSYLWNFGDGNTSTEQYPFHIYSTAGHYLICLMITDATGCSDTICKAVRGELIKNLIVVNPNETEVQEKSISVTTVFPNPASDMLEISLNQVIQGEIRIIDITGREVYKERFNANNVKANVSNLPAGFYDLSIVAGDKINHRKIAIVR